MPCWTRSSLLMEYHGVLEDSNIPTEGCSAGVSLQCHGTSNFHDNTWTLVSGMRPLRATMHIKHNKTAPDIDSYSWTHQHRHRASQVIVQKLPETQNITCCLTKIVWLREEHSNCWDILVETFLLYRRVQSKCT